MHSVRKQVLPATEAAYQPGGALYGLKQLQDDYKPGAEFEFPTFVPNFAEHIKPQLVASYNLWYINGLVTAKHNSLISVNLGNPGTKYATARKRVLSYMRPPQGAVGPTGPRTMPKLLGDDPYIGTMPDAVKNLALTRVQYGLLRRWAIGSFSTTVAPPAPPAITPHGLDRAALENCSGGAFFPGIEFGWQMRNPALFAGPLRLNPAAFSAYLGEDGVPMGPGHFSRQMAVPWQADFNDCRNEGNYGWWPSPRPTHALPAPNASKRTDWARATDRFAAGNLESTHEDMVVNWWKFAFVLEDGNLFVEKERVEPIV